MKGRLNQGPQFNSVRTFGDSGLVVTVLQPAWGYMRCTNWAIALGVRLPGTDLCLQERTMDGATAVLQMVWSQVLWEVGGGVRKRRKRKVWS